MTKICTNKYRFQILYVNFRIYHGIMIIAGLLNLLYQFHAEVFIMPGVSPASYAIKDARASILKIKDANYIEYFA